MIVLLAAVGIAFSLAGFEFARTWERDRGRHQTEDRVQGYAAAIGRTVTSDLDILHSIAALFSTAYYVGREDFTRFTTSLRARGSGVKALEWIPRVPAEERDDYERLARNDGFSDFRITERDAGGAMVAAGRRADYFPVFFVTPLEGNERALGFDLGSNPTRRAALEKARDTGKLVVSERITLVQEIGQEFAVLAFLPLYRQGFPNATVELRRKNLVGFALGVFRVGDLIRTALGKIERFDDVDVYVYDKDAPAENHFLHFQPSPGGSADVSPKSSEEIHSGAHPSVVVPIADRAWELVFRLAPGFGKDGATWIPWLALGAGLLLTGMLALYLRGVQGRAREVKTLVATRTSQLKRANEGLRDSQRRYGDLIEGSAQGIMIARNGVPLFANKAYGEIFGYENVNEVLMFESLDSLYAPDELPRIREYRTSRLQGQSPPEHYEFRGVKRDGTRIWVENRASVITWLGEPATQSTVIDITERKRAEVELRAAEEQTRLILDSAGEGIYGLDLEGKTTFVNPAVCAMLGYSADELIGQPMHALAHHSYPDGAPYPREKSPMYAAFTDGGVHHVTDEALWRKDGSSFPIEYTSTPIRKEGALVGAVVTFKDITERQKIDQMKNEFISTVSHELRTPLTSIKGALGLIRGGAAGELPKKLGSMIDIALTNTDRLVRLINDILSIEKIEAGKMEFRFQPTEIGPLLEQAIEANKAYGEEFKVKFVLREIPEATVNGDPDRLMQVLANLLSNAAKFSPAGAEVAISATRQAGTVRVSVSDRGPGIPEEYHGRLFDKFSQADSSDSRQKGGTGLGLSISKAIVEKHGGTIGFTTAAGEDTTFFVDLPVLRVPPKATPAEAKAPAGNRVLVCEDDRDVAILLSMMLEQGGFDTDVALTAAEAKRLLAENAYAAMTVDLALPDQLGTSLIRELRTDEKTRDLPIVVVSAHIDAGSKELNGDAFGIIDWISKPIDPERVLQGVRMAVRGSDNGTPRVLHVEDDPDMLTVVANIVGNAAEVTPAKSLKEAQRRLRDEDFDLVILDLMLPDGSGESLIPSLRKPGGRATPVIVFSVKEASRDTAEGVAAALVEAQTSNEDLLNTIKSFLDVREPA